MRRSAKSKIARTLDWRNFKPSMITLRCIYSVLSQEIGWEERLQNDLFYAGRMGRKSLFHSTNLRWMLTQYNYKLCSQQVDSWTHTRLHLGLTDTIVDIPARSAPRAPSCAADTSTIGDRAFYVATLRAWNRLPTELKLLRSMDSFRLELKTFLFEYVYGQQRTDRSALWCALGLYTSIGAQYEYLG